MLEHLLKTLERQRTDGVFKFKIIVADNDPARSAEPVVAACARTSPIEIVYAPEPRKNIALARNKTLEHARGDFVAFIDDDEFPTDDWILQALDACARYNAAGVLGPVRPHFARQPPAWVIRGRFCERPEPPTGTILGWGQCRTGNVLFRRSILDGVPEPFLPEFGTGGEDVDFFRRMKDERGCRFVWCREAVVYETVPPSRWTRSYMLKRALLRGQNSYKRPDGKALRYRSIIALPLYGVALPVLAMLGHHLFMTYCIKWCDHAGRLLAMVRIRAMTERNM